MAEPRVLKLQSPAYGDPIFYKWPLVISKKHDESSEIIETIRLVCEDFPELKYAVENVILNDYDPKNFESMNQLCQRYNKAIRNILSLWKGRAPPPRMYTAPSKDLLRHIINMCYSHAITVPEKLNIYEPFSPEVYGETSFDMVAQILDDLPHGGKDECFVDLGSGVGQVVLQAAASNRFKECYGVEKAETPAKYAALMETEFKKWMDWFGKIYSDFTLEKGDFLEDKWIDIINDSGVIFVNNFAFGPVVNHQLKMKFQSMKEGSKIVSSREFSPTNFKFNKRNLSELGAMMKVTEIKPRSEEATVSWTGNTVSYYLHVVDRTRLEKYFSILKKRKDGQELDEDEMSLYSESNCSADTCNPAKTIESLEENLDDLYLGTTTRHQWQLLTDTIKQSKQDAVDPAGSIETNNKTKLGRSGRKSFQSTSKKANCGLKNKILRRYGQLAIQKALQAAEKDVSFHDNNNNKDDGEDTSTSTEEESDGESDGDSSDSDYKTEKKVKEQKEKSKLKLKNTNMKLNSRFKSNIQKRNVNLKETRVFAKKKKSSLKIDRGLRVDVDNFFDGMKDKYMEFIERINTKEYARRLTVMIECEAAKKKLLEREISGVDQTVQELISKGLKNFSSRLDELDLAVRTPLELLSRSTALAEKRKHLEDKVIDMEIEVYDLEEKHRRLFVARDEKNLERTSDALFLSGDEDSSQNDKSTEPLLTTKLCTAIMSALNHRRSLIDKESSLSEQISILGKIAKPNQKTMSINGNMDGHESNDEKSKSQCPKTRPVAFVPPRMLSNDKQKSISPVSLPIQSTPHSDALNTPTPENIETVRRGRGRPRKRPKPNDESASQSDASQDNKLTNERSPHPMVLESNHRQNVTNHIERPSRPDTKMFTNKVLEEQAPISIPHNDNVVKPVTSTEFQKSPAEPYGLTLSKSISSDELTSLSTTGKQASTHNTPTKLCASANAVSDKRKSNKKSGDVGAELLSAMLSQRKSRKDTGESCDVLNSVLDSQKQFTMTTANKILLPHGFFDQVSSRNKIYDNLQFGYLRHIAKDEKETRSPHLISPCYEKTAAGCKQDEQTHASGKIYDSKQEIPSLQPATNCLLGKVNGCFDSTVAEKSRRIKKVAKKTRKVTKRVKPSKDNGLSLYCYPELSCSDNTPSSVKSLCDDRSTLFSVDEHFKTSLNKLHREGKAFLDCALQPPSKPFNNQFLQNQNSSANKPLNELQLSTKTISVMSSSVAQKREVQKETEKRGDNTKTKYSDQIHKTNDSFFPLNTRIPISANSAFGQELTCNANVFHRESVLKGMTFKRSTVTPICSAETARVFKDNPTAVTKSSQHHGFNLQSFGSSALHISGSSGAKVVNNPHDLLTVSTVLKSSESGFFANLLDKTTNIRNAPSSVPGGHFAYFPSTTIPTDRVSVISTSDNSSTPETSLLKSFFIIPNSSLSLNLAQNTGPSICLPPSRPIGTDKKLENALPPPVKKTKLNKKNVTVSVTSSSSSIRDLHGLFGAAQSSSMSHVRKPHILDPSQTLLSNSQDHNSKNLFKPQVINVSQPRSTVNSVVATKSVTSFLHDNQSVFASTVERTASSYHQSQLHVNPPNVLFLPVHSALNSINRSGITLASSEKPTQLLSTLPIYPSFAKHSET